MAKKVHEIKRMEETEAARAGLLILARLIARRHLARTTGLEKGDDAEHMEHSIERDGNDR
ncbi:MAG: hypothetical protein ISS53_05935 [Dehalococcoidia bacterium]|nr:hypothetical protein [Dehalococcoidia bacterium]